VLELTGKALPVDVVLGGDVLDQFVIGKPGRREWLWFARGRRPLVAVLFRHRRKPGKARGLECGASSAL
jgi:hypothetical protein